MNQSTVKLDRLDRMASAVARRLSLILFISGPVVLAVAFAAGSLDLMIRSLTIAIPLSGAPVVFRLLKTKAATGAAAIPVTRKLSVLNPLLLFVLLYIVSIGVLWYSGHRTSIYFFLVSAMALCVLIEIIYADTESRLVRWAILAQVLFLSLNLLLSPQIAYAVFVSGDGWAHIANANVLTAARHTSLAMVDYYYTPSFHIASTLVGNTLGISSYSSTKLVTVAAGLMELLFVFLLVARLSRNFKMALLSALFLAVGRYFLYEGSITQPQTVGISVLVAVFYLMQTGRYNGLSRGLTLMFMLFLVSLHLFSSGAFLVLLVFYFLVERVSMTGETKTAHLTIDAAMLFVVVFIGYHMATSLFYRVVSSVVEATDSNSPLRSLEAISAPSISGSAALLGNLDLVAYSLLALLGLLLVFDGKNRPEYRGLMGLAKLTAPLLVFYWGLPTLAPALLPLMVGRVTFFTEPFVVVIGAVAAVTLLQLIRSVRWIVLALLIGGVIVVFSIANSVSSAESPLTAPRPSEGYTLDAHEVAGADFIGAIGNPANAVTDWHYGWYFSYVRTEMDPVGQLFAVYRYGRPMKAGWKETLEAEILQQNEYFILRNGTNAESGLTIPTIGAIKLDSDILRKLDEENRIYSNGEVTYYRKLLKAIPR